MRWLTSATAFGIKTLHQQNPPVLKWRCLLMQVDLYNGRKTDVVIVVYLLRIPVRPHTHTHTHTHPFNGPLSGTTRVSRYQKDKTNLDLTKARDSEWQWHQLGHTQVCTSLQTNNHASTPPLSLLQAGSCRPTNSVKALSDQLSQNLPDRSSPNLKGWLWLWMIKLKLVL